jgi:deoxycytidine triphosphate deaminase
MNRDEALNQKSSKQKEIERLTAFPSAPYYSSPGGHRERPQGVLLSDEIEFYCKNYKLLDPYEPTNIKAANYELRVGLKYSVAGQSHVLNLGDVLTIPKFEVAVIEILETVNIPDFMIGRWNIRTRWAYKGLVWVGGPQVDAGFRGLLMCPIWNLSNTDFRIKSGEEIAIIDFEFTTPPTGKSTRYPWNHRTRYVFDDYEAPRSGLVTDAVEAIKRLEAESIDSRNKTGDVLEQSRARIDTVTALMFTALGVLTAAVTLFATKPLTADQYWWDPTILWLSTATTVLALLAWVKGQSNGSWRWRIKIFVLILGLLAMGLLVFRDAQHANRLNAAQTQIQELSRRIDSLEKSKPVPK